MKILDNKFSWSIARHNLFYRCKLEYFYHYYGSWGGWDKSAKERTVLLNRLKNIQNEEYYVKYLLTSAVSSFFSKNISFSQKDFLFFMKRKMNLNLLEMEKCEFLIDHKKLCLYAYYNDNKSIDNIRKSLSQKIEFILDFLFTAKEFLELEKLGYLNIISSSTFEKFFVGSEEINIFSDLLFYSKGNVSAINFILTDYQDVHIISDLLHLWLASISIYKNFEKNIHLIMPFNREVLLVKKNDNLEATISKIQRSIADMRLRLTSNGIAIEENFYPCANKEKCHTCRFQKACMAK